MVELKNHRYKKTDVQRLIEKIDDENSRVAKIAQKIIISELFTQLSAFFCYYCPSNIVQRGRTD